MPEFKFTALELTLMASFLSLLVNIATRKYCEQNYVSKSEFKKLNTKMDTSYKMLRALVAQTVEDRDKQQEILNITGE